jgi:hypothetical protein
MRSIVRLISVFSCLLTVSMIAGSPGESRAATRYPLTCRGGDGINLKLFHNTAWFNNTLLVTFNHAPVASSRGLSPGECAWADRPLTASRG